MDQGLVVRRRGIGTRVVRPKMRRPLELTSLYDDLASSGQSPATEVLSFETVGADRTVADMLAVSEGNPVVEIVRIRSAAGNPIAKMTNYLPPRVVSFDEAALVERGLYELIRAQGIQLHSATQTIGARRASTGEAKLLGEVSGAAVLTMQRVTYDDHGDAIEYGSRIYASSRYSFEIHLMSG